MLQICREESVGMCQTRSSPRPLAPNTPQSAALISFPKLMALELGIVRNLVEVDR